MKYFISIALLLSYLMSNSSFSQDTFPVLTGPYMGQKPPGRIAEPFAPGTISKEGWEIEGVFAPGMREFYYTTRGADSKKIIVIGFREHNNVWTKYLEFPRQGEITFSPDGQRMHMADGYKDRLDDGWSERQTLGPMFDREDWGIMRLSASEKETYVFDDYKSSDVLRISRFENGKRTQPQKMSANFNTGKWTAHPFIAPDESYLIWDSERPEGFGNSDLYISFRQTDGSWGPAINMGEDINSDKWDAYASVTPDGKFILFNRGIDDDGNVDIYWADAKIIEDLRTK
ncbi:PD40 domain-containing protein [Shewanella sp. UCD-KL12]|uniref:PD40 domain-containing protein n=1 Tax=Shewanella sp. UCD-KL12 TaxID=1917163 RepID=UPI000970E27D|nr:PD40 domain-containing protein [Shewanella sp. UCD-KL12]